MRPRPTLPENEQNTQVYELWFSAGLGACDLQHITEETLGDDRQPPLIRQSLESLKGEVREQHMNKFANALFIQLNAVKPSVKVRYLKGGFEIVGDNPRGARRPQGVRLLQRPCHRDQARGGGRRQRRGRAREALWRLRQSPPHQGDRGESGGFGRYLQNQNNSGYYYYNFGRPLENYRDKFQEIVKQALQEQFEVISVTFQDEKVNSRSTSEYGWRFTPYAYLLLKARSPKVDKIAPVRLDLDFMDTSGYVILPVESAALPIDAKPAKGGVRPHEKLQITQSLDERQAKDGKLILEVKATARVWFPTSSRFLTSTRLDLSSRRPTTRGSRSRSSTLTARPAVSIRSAPGWSRSAAPDLHRAAQDVHVC